jgi:ribose transport system substrate-binding protein
MIMKRLVVAAGVVAGLICGAPPMAQMKPTVAIVAKDQGQPYWQAVLAGARKAGQDLGVGVSEVAEADAGAGLDNAVAAKPSAIIVAPWQFSGQAAKLDEAANKVKIAGIGSAGDSKRIAALIATDNLNAGRLAAKAPATGITGAHGDTEGNVVIISSMSGVAMLDQRAKGFKDLLAEKYRALAIVGEKTADGKAATALSIMNDFIANTADLRGVFVTDPVMTQAVAEKKSDDKIVVVGVGSGDQLVKYLQDSTITGLVLEDPCRIGYDSVKTALAASKGEKVAANMDIDATLVTKANMSSPRSQELLNPKVK